jgi:hypothetical protein
MNAAAGPAFQDDGSPCHGAYGQTGQYQRLRIERRCLLLAYRKRAKGFAVLVRPRDMKLISLLQRGTAHGFWPGQGTRAVMAVSAGYAGCREDPRIFWRRLR